MNRKGMRTLMSMLLLVALLITAVACAPSTTTTVAPTQAATAAPTTAATPGTTAAGTAVGTTTVAGTTAAGATTVAGTTAATTAAPGKTVTINWFWREGGDIQVPENSYIVQKVLKDLNIKYNHITPVGMTTDEKLQTLLAVGDVPDIIESYNEQTTNLRRYGVIIPVDQYFTEAKLGHVMKNQYQWDKAAAMMKRSDGKSWAIPVTFPAASGPVTYIRYDWLKNLNLEVPKTFEELAKVLEAFTKNDPDKNGKNDTVGTSYGGIYSGFDVNFGASPFAWYQAADGVQMGIYNEQMPAYLKYLKGLIDTGALDREIADPDELGEKHGNNIKAGKIGFTFGYSDVNVNDDIRKIQPEADWRPMPPPKEFYDKGYLPIGSILRQEYVISKEAEKQGKVEDVLRLMNYMADDGGLINGKINYDAPYWEVSYGQRGVNWDVTADGKFDTGTYNPTIKANNDPYSYLRGRSRRFRTMASQAAFETGLREDQAKALTEIRTYPLMFDIPAAVGAQIFAEGVELPQEYVVFQRQMDQLWNTFYMKALLGQVPIDSGLEELRKQGMDYDYANVKKMMAEVFKGAGKIK